jgi:hypothetical protein
MFGHRRTKVRARQEADEHVFFFPPPVFPSFVVLREADWPLQSRNVEEDSLVTKKAENKKQLKQKLDDRPEPKALEERGILPKDSAPKSEGKGSRKSATASGWGRKDSAPNTPSQERRKSSVFARTKSTKLSVGDVAPSVIGLTVLEACEREGGQVPRLVEQCIAYLYRVGFEEPGIFRVSGDKTQIDQVVTEFDKGALAPLDGVEDVHVVTSLLKLFFRLAPQPLFTVEAHGALLASLGTPEAARVAAFVELLKGLPPPCLSTVLVLFPLLRAVADRSDVNRMSPNNLGIVFGPTLLRSQAELNGEVDMSNRSAYVVEFLINQWPTISKSLGGANSSPPPQSQSPVGAAPLPSMLPPPPVSGAPVPPPASTKPGGLMSVATSDRSGPIKLPATTGVATPVALRKGPPPIPGGASASMGSMAHHVPPGVNGSSAGQPLPPPPAAVLPPAGLAAAVAGSPMLRRPSPVAAGAGGGGGGGVGSRPPSAALPSPIASPPPPAMLPPPVAAAPAAAPGARQAVALYNFSGDASKGQIDLVKNAALLVHVEHSAGWSTVECNGRTGFVPSSYYK